MGQALYRKHRPKSLGDVVGQGHVTETLRTALDSGRISHAYLFSGPRGVGKTSIARILAHEINHLPYEDGAAHMDIIEIDAASNNSVEDVRDLREKVYVAPAAAKYKVYIIDEVHMLSKAAFNALLKTLEEPPAHVVFILATTDVNKLPDTIVSRTQHYTFKPVGRQKVIEHLTDIAKQEGLELDKEALALIADHGEGSFRDSISLLDQAGGMTRSKKGAAISGAQVRQLLGIAPQEAIDQLLAAVAQPGQAAGIMGQLSGLYAQGLQASAIASQLSARLRTSLADSSPLLPTNQTLGLMRTLIDVPASRSPERLLEIVMLESAGTSDMPQPQAARVTTTITAAVAPHSVATPPPAVPQKMPAASKPEAAPGKPPAKPVVQAIAAEVTTEVVQSAAQPPLPAAPDTPAGPKEHSFTPGVALDSAIWPQLLDSIRKEYNTLYGVLRMSKPVFSDDGLELQFKFAFHQKRLNEVKNRQIIAGYIRDITGKDVNVTCVYNKEATPGPVNAPAAGTAAALATSAHNTAIDAISDIFGGGEVM